MMLSTSPVEAGLVTTNPPPPTTTFTDFAHEPLPGVCAATVRFAVPAGSAPPGTRTSNPEAAQYEFPVADATSGRPIATVPWASDVLPLSTCTSSMPAQPSAAMSTTQPLT